MSEEDQGGYPVPPDVARKIIDYFEQFRGDDNEDVVCPETKGLHSWRYETEWGTGWPIITCMFCGLKLNVT